MEPQRVKGFVIGFDTPSKGQSVWKVRVKDSTSQYNGQKLIVASVHGGLELARGLNVHFAVGTIDNPSGSEVLRAVDVCLQNPGEDQTNDVRSKGDRT